MAVDIKAVLGQWIELRTAAGMTNGQALLIQNKGLPVLVMEASASPAANSDDGYHLGTGKVIEVSGSELGVWVKAQHDAARLFVQEV